MLLTLSFPLLRFGLSLPLIQVCLLWLWSRGIMWRIWIILTYSSRIHGRQVHTTGKRDEKVLFIHQLTMQKGIWSHKTVGSNDAKIGRI